MRTASPEVYIGVFILVAILMLLTEKGRDIFLSILTVTITIVVVLALLPFLFVLDLLVYIILSIQGEGHRHKSVISGISEFIKNGGKR